MQMDSVESAGGRLGAVLTAPRTGMVPLSPVGPWLAATPTLAKQVLMDPDRFDFPSDVTRSGDLSGSRGETRSGHTVFTPLTPAQVGLGVSVFEREWLSALEEHHRTNPQQPYDAMVLLRRPVARSTTAAVLTSLDRKSRDEIGDLVLAWIDALGPVIAARRPPRRWSRRRRAEARARLALEQRLAQLPGQQPTAMQLATMLAAGIQVPIAAGSFLLAWLGDHPTGEIDPTHAVWETLRLTPPTWITARITTTTVELDGLTLPAGRVVLVSPLLLGRFEQLVPGHPDAITAFAPDRWRDADQRPGAWLPFGAGPHACPGRSLGMAQLVHLARWGVTNGIRLAAPVSIDQSRGISPSPCLFVTIHRPEAPT
jgi:cytochrome P450